MFRKRVIIAVTLIVFQAYFSISPENHLYCTLFSISPSSCDSKTSVNQPEIEHVNEIAVAPNEKVLAVASSEGIWIYIIDPISTTPILLNNNTKPISHIAFSPNGMLLAFNYENDRNIHLWDFAVDQELQSIQSDSSEITDITFSSDNILAYANSDIDGEYGLLSNGRVSLKNIATNEESGSLQNVAAVVNNLNFNLDNSTLILEGIYPGYESHDVQLWDVKTLTQINKLPTSLIVTAAASDNSIIAVGGLDEYNTSHIQLWNTRTFEISKDISVDTGTITALTLNSHIVVSGSVGGIISAWDNKSGIEINRFQIDSEEVKQLYLAPNASIVAVLSTSNDMSAKIRLLNIKTGVVQTVKGNTHATG